MASTVQSLHSKPLQHTNLPETFAPLGIPSKIAHDILDLLSPHQRAKCSLICKEFQQFADQPVFWQRVLTARFPHFEMKTDTNFKQAYSEACRTEFMLSSNIKFGRCTSYTLKGHQESHDFDNNVVRLQLCQNGELLSSTRGGEVIVWDIENKAMKSRKIPSAFINQDLDRTVVSFDFANSLMCLGDSQGGDIQILGHENDANILILRGHTKPLCHCFYDGKYLFSASEDKTVKMWDIQNAGNPCLHTFEGHPDKIVALATHKNLLFVATEENLKIWNIDTRNVVHDIKSKKDKSGVFEGKSAYFKCIAPVGQYVCTGSQHGALGIWDTTTGESLYYKRYAHDASVCSFATHGSFLFSGCWDGTIKVWDIPSATLVTTLNGSIGPVWSLAFRKGLLISGSSQGEVRVWDFNPRKTVD